MSKSVNSSLQYPLPRMLLALITGIIIGINYDPGLSPLILLTCFFGTLALFMVFMIPRQDKSVHAALKGSLALILCIELGGVLAWVNDPRTAADFVGRIQARGANLGLTGSLETQPIEYPTSTQFKLHINTATILGRQSQPASGTVMVIIHKPAPRLDLGDRVLVFGVLRPLQERYTPHAFDRRQYLGFHGVYHDFLVQGQNCVRLTGPAVTSAMVKAYEVQQACARLFKSSMRDSAASNFLSALLLGARSDMDPALYRAFSITGTVHIISVSGLHVQIVYAVFAWLLPASLLSFGRKELVILRRLALVCFIWFYALISGFSPAVVRSAVMISFFILAQGLPRKIPASMTFFASAMCILVADPWALADMGFQLSYLAVGSLLAFQMKIRLLLTFTNKLLAGVWNMIATSLAAQILTFPLCLFYFHQYPLYFLFANLVIIPLTSMMLYIGVFQLSICSLSLICSNTLINGCKNLICDFMGCCYEFMNWMLLRTGALKFACLGGSYPSITDTLLIYVLIAILALANKKDYQKTTVAGAFILSVLSAKNVCWQATTIRQKQVLNFSVRGRRLILKLSADTCLLEAKDLDKALYQRYILPELQANEISCVYYCP